MKIDKKSIIIAVTTLVIGLLAGWLIFGGSGSPEEQHSHSTEMAGETIWTCSMHPHIRQNEPGQCPICGMDLIPVASEEDENPDPMAISMSPTAMLLADIESAMVGKMTPVKTVRLNGKVEADERLIFSQSSHIPGRIEKLLVNFTGEYVNKGQVIAYIYSPELVTAQEELFEAQKIKETQPQLFNAAKEKLKNWKLTETQIDKILELGTLQEEFPILADVSGYVTQKMVNLGDYIPEGKSIYEIVDLSKIWVLFDVYESDMPWIKKGNKVVFTIQSLPGEIFQATVSYLDPVIDPKTRVAKARVEFSNSGLHLKPEMFVSGTVEAKLPNKSNALVVPKSAVMWTGKRSVVYAKSTTGKGVSFLMRDVTLGPALGNSYIVEEGLQEGEEIAVNGTFSIDAAAQLAGKPSMMNPEGGIAMTGHNHGGAPSANIPSAMKKNEKVSISADAKKALTPVFEAYFNLKGHLVKDDFDKAQESGIAMREQLKKISMAVFTGNAHNIWMKHKSELERELQHIAHQNTIEDLRKSFIGISNAMIALAQSFGSVSGDLYVQHCPMADDSQGADWLSKEKTIQNPYFGASMLTCGEIKKELK